MGSTIDVDLSSTTISHGQQDGAPLYDRETAGLAQRESLCHQYTATYGDGKSQLPFLSINPIRSSLPIHTLSAMTSGDSQCTLRRI